MIHYNQEQYRPTKDESILDCLLRHGIAPPHSCRSGLCQTCLMRSVKGKPPQASQKGLKQALVMQNYFLACSCIPQEDMEVVLPDTALFRRTTTILEKELLNSNVLRLRLSIPENFQYFAGQYLTIFKNNSVGRSYSLASVPGTDSYLEFHIKLIPNGQVSQWLADETAIGSAVTVSEPLGECIYLDKHRQQSMALIGTGTGLAPLVGVLRDALRQGHREIIHLYHGVQTRQDLYLHETLLELATQYENVKYHPCLSREPVSPGLRQGRASELAMQDIGDFRNWCVYLCGNPDMVNSAKRSIFLAGASMQDIHADPFIHG